MSLKLNLFSLFDVYASPRLIDLLSVLRATHAKLRVLLEGTHIVDWFFFNSLIMRVTCRIS